MLHIFLNFIWTLVCSVSIVFVCYSIWQWLSKKSSKKSSYKIVYEYMMIAQTIESDYDGISYILKRETFYQS